MRSSCCSESDSPDDKHRRGGKAVRLTYDHKGSDPQEAKRITDAGGFVMNNRVNGATDLLPDRLSAHRSLRRSGRHEVSRRLGYEVLHRRLAVYDRASSHATAWLCHDTSHRRRLWETTMTSSSSPATACVVPCLVICTFLIARAQLWDVCEDQDAVDLIRDIEDPQQASRALLDHALTNFSTGVSSLGSRFGLELSRCAHR